MPEAVLITYQLLAPIVAEPPASPAPLHALTPLLGTEKGLSTIQ